MTHAGKGENAEPVWPPAPDLGFSFRLASGAGHLTLEDRLFEGWLDIERLELEVPGLEPPIDMAAGAERFQNRRTQVTSAALSVGQRQLDHLVATLAPRLVAVGADRVALRPAGDHISVSARFRDGSHLADLVATVRILPRGGPIALVVDQALVFGFLPTPPPLLAHRLLTAITGASADPHYPGAPVIRGLGLVEVDTLAALLWHLFPPRGWRLPDPGKVALIAVRPDRGKMIARFARGGQGAGTDSAGARLLGSLARHHSADLAIMRGDLDTALHEYRTALASQAGDQEFIYQRLLGLAASTRDHFAFAIDLARDALSRWPDFAAAHAAVGSVRLEQGDQWAAAERYRTLARTAGRIDDEAAVRAALLGARLLGRESPDQATALYELVAELRPGQSEATDALIGHYRQHGRIHELVRLLRSRIAQSPNPRAQVSDQLVLAGLYLQDLSDPQSALEVAERAAHSSADHGEAELMVARAHLASGKREPAIAALDRAAEKLGAAGDQRGHCDALLQAAELLGDSGEHAQALAAYRRVLALRSNDATALAGAARAKVALGDQAGAAALWQQLVDSSTDLPVKVASYALELGRCLLTIGETAAALEQLAWASERGDALVRGRAHTLLADQASKDGESEVAIAELGHAIVALGDDSSPSAREIGNDPVREATAIAHQRRAELLAELGRGAAAAADYQLAFELHAGADARAFVAEELLDIARHKGDEIAARRWLDALLELELPAERRVEWLLERARRALESGDPDRDRIGADIEAALSIADGHDHRASALELKALLKGGSEDPVGRAETLTQRIELAEGSFERAVARTQAARAWLEADRADEALRLAQEATRALREESKVDYSEAWVVLGDAAWRRRAWALVIDAADRLRSGSFDVAPEVAVRQLHRAGIAFSETGDLEAAAESLEEVTADDATPADLRSHTHRLLAGIYERLDRIDEAAGAFEAFARSEDAEVAESTRADAWYRAGELHRRRPEGADDAERCLEESLRLVSDHLPALDALERLKRESQDYERVAIILSRKIAATAPHPNRQKSLLARLADLQHLRLGRTDVARESYRRALEIDPGFRPALRFWVADARERGDLTEVADALSKLALELESDLDLPDDATALAEERVSAAAQLAELAAESDDPDLADRALAALEANLVPDSYDDRILEGMERVLRAKSDWRAVADVLGQRAANSKRSEALSWDLERVDLLMTAVADRGAALAAARAALSRHPNDSGLAEVIAELERDGPTRTQVAPGASHIRPADLRAEADEAFAAGDFQRAATVLEQLVSYQPLAGGARQFGNRAARAELFLQLADLYYDHLDNPKRARECMRRAAEAFGSGARRDATLRLLASEALSAGAPAVTVGSLEAIEAHRLTGNDRLQLARALTKLERDQRAIEILEQARVRGSLTEESARLLSHLYRERERKSELAESLAQGAKDSPPEIAEVRLREALNLFENALASAEGAERVRRQISELGSETDRVPAAADLERAAEAALEDGDSAVAADLLSRAVHERTRVLGKAGEGADAALLATLDRLRRVTYTIAPSPDLGGTGHFEALVRGLLSAATISSKEATVSLAREAGSVKRNQLRDPRGAAEALTRAFTSSPEHGALFSELAEVLRESGDIPQLVAAYELRLETLEGAARARALRELARILRSARGENDRVRELLAEANDVEPKERAPTEAEREADAQVELDRGAELEAEGKRDEAVAHYYASFAKNPADPRPLEALDRLYGALGDSESQANVLGQLIELATEHETRAELWERRARLYRDHLRRPQDAYRCLKEAYANAPEHQSIAHGLRSMAMARGEWPLAAELLYREIANADDDRERAALQFELALIYDEKLIDPAQAIRNYSQALALDPSIPSAPAPLARLYENTGDFASAAETFELAASLAAVDDERHNLLRRAAMAADKAGKEDDAKRLAAMAGELVTRRDGDSDNLLRALDGAESDDERLDILHKLLAQASEDGDHVRVRSHAREILTIDGSDSTAYLELKKQAEAAESWDTVAELLERRAQSVDDNRDRAQLYFELGQCYQGQLSDTPQAVRAFQAALLADPSHPGALDALAQIAYLRSDWETARELYNRLDPEVSAMAPELIAFRRGEVAEMLGLDSEAAAAFAAAASLAPKNEAALTALIGAAVRMHDLSTAIDAARSRLELIPAEELGAMTTARLQLAELCDAANDIVTAIYYYEMVLAEDPNNRHALESLVTLYAAHGDHQGAIRTLRSLIAIASDLAERAERHYTLGEIFRANVGDHEAAANEYLKAVDLDPNHAPTLRRLLDYYWALDEDQALLEIAADLHSKDALIVIETPSPTLARVMLAAALREDPLAVRIADSLPGDVNHSTAVAMVEALDIGRSPSADDLAGAAGWLAEQVTAVSREALADYLGSGEHDETKAALYAALLGS